MRNPSGWNLPWNVDFNLSVGGSPRLFVDGVVGGLHIVVDLEERCPDEVPVQGEGVLPGLLPNLGTGVGVRLKREIDHPQIEIKSIKVIKTQGFFSSQSFFIQN